MKSIPLFLALVLLTARSAFGQTTPTPPDGDHSDLQANSNFVKLKNIGGPWFDKTVNSVTGTGNLSTFGVGFSGGQSPGAQSGNETNNSLVLNVPVDISLGNLTLSLTGNTAYFAAKPGYQFIPSDFYFETVVASTNTTGNVTAVFTAGVPAAGGNLSVVTTIPFSALQGNITEPTLTANTSVGTITFPVGALGGPPITSTTPLYLFINSASNGGNGTEVVIPHVKGIVTKQ